MHPVVGRAGILFTKAANKCAVLYPGHIAGVAETSKTVGSFFGIQANKGSLFFEQGTKIIVFLLATIAPMNRTGFAMGGHLLDPGIKFGTGLGSFGNKKILLSRLSNNLDKASVSAG
jgi:hypothetical protein